LRRVVAVFFFADHGPLYQHTKDLLKLRRDDAGFRSQKPSALDGAVLGDGRSYSGSSWTAARTDYSS